MPQTRSQAKAAAAAATAAEPPDVKTETPEPPTSQSGQLHAEASHDRKHSTIAQRSIALELWNQGLPTGDIALRSGLTTRSEPRRVVRLHEGHRGHVIAGSLLTVGRRGGLADIDGEIDAQVDVEEAAAWRTVPAGKLGEAVAHRGACSLSVEDGEEGGNGGVPVSGCEDDMGATSEKGHRAWETSLGRFGRYKSLANEASTFRPIQPKQSAVEETTWRKHAEAIAKSLPKRPPRGGSRSKRKRRFRKTASRESSAQHQSPSQLPRPSSPGERGDPWAVDSDRPLRHRHFLPQKRGPEDGDRGDTAAAGDVPGVRSRKGPTLRPIQPKEPVFENLRENEQLAAAIASGLPKRRRGRSWRVKGVPSRRGFWNAAGTAQHPGSSPVGDSGADAGVDDAAAEPADGSLSGRRLQQREVGGSSAAAVAEPVMFGRQRLPQQGRRGYRKGQGLTRSRLRMENVRLHGTGPVQCHEPEGASGDAPVVGQPSPKLAYATACEEVNQPTREEITHPGRPRRRQKRGRLRSRDEGPRKEVRGGVGRERRRELQAEDLASVLHVLEEDFAMKERLSNDQTWCTPIPLERKVSTVRDFYQAFHDAGTLPIRTCMLCYRKCTRKELREITWGHWLSSCVPKGGRSPFSCRSCFPEGESVSVCAECGRWLARGSLSPAAHLHSRLGCEHMFPDELRGLTPVEEKLISLNSCYGFVTRYSIPGGQRQGVRYPRHVKGHITVFPNNVQELATKVLPHPLLQALDEIHVSWQGAEKPAPSDLSSLLSVRRRVVGRALVWLKTNNPHYAEIAIDEAEMESWGDPIHGVPASPSLQLIKKVNLRGEKVSKGTAAHVDGG
ncbi:hypothetical protein HIM_11384 [Hirsutella minnesotensis 3608]|uniref:DUF6570 domain-containing protein n=1 Tax=Hirsutella minnesotensis 3608 TaxID=1043627 RepID=A0A0F7ZFI9_9HYPO|nr:hypothetical protein HIM_11384 [Hirsutella minnesotensis 3608]